MTRIIVGLGSLVFFVYLAFNVGHFEGRKAGMREALRTDPISDQLEMTCLGLWVGELNKQAVIKEKK